MDTPTNPHELVWPKFENEEHEFFYSLPQLPYSDMSFPDGFGCLDWGEEEFGLQDQNQNTCLDIVPAPLESLQYSCESMDVYLQTSVPKLTQGEVYEEQMMVSSLYEMKNQNVLKSENGVDSRDKRRIKRYNQKEEKNRMLNRDDLSKYFYFPITQAAKELKVGLTFLKKRCRELGISRWPHRKLMSIQTLIDNLYEYDREQMGNESGRLRESIAILEREKKLIEEVPDMEMENQTKRLRQACFKANYKKRKFMENSRCYNYNYSGTTQQQLCIEYSSSSSSSYNPTANILEY